MGHLAGLGLVGGLLGLLVGLLGLALLLLFRFLAEKFN
jgi:hypothetical protein